MDIKELILRGEDINKEKFVAGFSHYAKGISLINNNAENWIDLDNPAYSFADFFLSSIEYLNKMTLESGNTSTVSEVTKETSYAIFPNGDTFKTVEYNHEGFYLYWMLHNAKDKFIEFLSASMYDLNEFMYKSFGAVNFSYGGGTGSVALTENVVLSRQQKEVLFKIYEANGIAERYFKEVEQI